MSSVFFPPLLPATVPGGFNLAGGAGDGPAGGLPRTPSEDFFGVGQRCVLNDRRRLAASMTSPSAAGRTAEASGSDGAVSTDDAASGSGSTAEDPAEFVFCIITAALLGLGGADCEGVPAGAALRNMAGPPPPPTGLGGPPAGALVCIRPFSIGCALGGWGFLAWAAWAFCCAAALARMRAATSSDTWLTIDLTSSLADSWMRLSVRGFATSMVNGRLWSPKIP
mmetsp:Transcript_30484/g.72515  ORF Transcript_30484/g.72515 Transcript_30484/m.72515 type:complete len:224 (-) Transcript_30484:28-699(-)